MDHASLTLFRIFLIILFVDGIKLIAEAFMHGSPSERPKFKGDPEKVTVIVAAYNEEGSILKTIRSFLPIVPAYNIMIVDDGSKDRTAELVSFYYPEVRLFSIPNGGKVNAIHHALRHVITPYVLLIDADIEVEPGFVIPTEALETGYATAVCFDVIPRISGKSFFSRLCLAFQSHEYAKAMHIGKRFSDVTKCIQCISGAAGLYITERLRRYAPDHSTIFPGEDLERALQDLGDNGSIIFSPMAVYTDVPESLFSLAQQRSRGWWPGLWRNVWRFIKLIVTRRDAIRLQLELAYEIFALVSIPTKILSLVVLIYYKEWTYLLFTYLVYVFLEIILFFRIKHITKKYMNMEALTIALYPFYSEMQMLCVARAFFVYIHRRFLTNKWQKRVVTMLLLLPAFSYAQDTAQKKKPWTVDYEYSHIVDPGKDRSFEQHQLYVGYRKVYAVFNSAPYNTVNVGGYFGPFIVDTRYQWTSNGFSARVQYEHWFGNFVPHVMAQYGTSERVPLSTNPSFPSGGIGFSYYLSDDKSNVSADAIKDFGRLHTETYGAKIKLFFSTISVGAGLSINSLGDPGSYGTVGYKWFYIHADYYQHFDLNNFDRTSIGVGIKKQF